VGTTKTIIIEVEVPWSLAGVRTALAAATVANVELMKEWKKQGRKVPRLYQAGVKWKRQPPERFSLFPTVLARGNGDCDQLAAWRAAELQLKGIKAKAIPRWVRPKLMHVVVQLPSGRLEDPSRLLGMGKREGMRAPRKRRRAA
jgi:hypothetical protein